MTGEELFSSSAPAPLTERVYRQLESDILGGRYAPGTSLVELSLSSELGVSRTPVREALKMLEQHGLVSMQPHRGTVVLGVRGEDLRDIYEIRMRTEGLAARRTAERIGDGELRELTTIVELQEFYLSKNGTENLQELDSRFHERIFEYCGSRMLCHMLTELHHTIQRYRALSLSVDGRGARAIAEHRGILEAIAAHDGEETERRTEAHIRSAWENLRGVVSEA